MNDKFPNEDYEVCELNNLDKDIDLSIINPKYIFYFDENFNNYYSDSKPNLAREGHKSEITEIRSLNGNLKHRIQIVTTEKDRDKAVKKAQDMLAKDKAKKAGL